MKRNKKRGNNRRKSRNFSKLSFFQKTGSKQFKTCPLSGKSAPVIDYKNIKILKKYISENGKILPSRITFVSRKKQRELSKSIKKARILALI
jgi:small subunit ribosomal protein S18